MAQANWASLSRCPSFVAAALVPELIIVKRFFPYPFLFLFLGAIVATFWEMPLPHTFPVLATARKIRPSPMLNN